MDFIKLINLDKSGIYAIVFIDDGIEKIYIGSTNRNFKIRFKDHLNDLNNNRHINNKMQDLFNKNIEFEFRILEIYKGEIDELINKELYWIKQVKKSSLLNIASPVPNSSFGYHHSPETKEKIKQGVINHNIKRSEYEANINKEPNFYLYHYFIKKISNAIIYDSYKAESHLEELLKEYPRNKVLEWFYRGDLDYLEIDMNTISSYFRPNELIIDIKYAWWNGYLFSI